MTPDSSPPPVGRTCFREPIPEIARCAQLLDDAVSAHLADNRSVATALIRQANMTVVRDWCESLWGKKSGYVHYGHVPDAPAFLPDHGRSTNRMPTAETKNRLIERDGHHCRFCGIPVIRREVRERIRRTYPEAKLWGRTNAEQHAAFQTMWLQFDHLVDCND